MIVVNFIGSIFLLLDVYKARSRAHHKRDRIDFFGCDSSSVSCASDSSISNSHLDSSDISGITDENSEDCDSKEHKNRSGITSFSRALGKKAYGTLKKLIETKNFKNKGEEARNIALANSINFYFEMISQFLPNNLVDKYINLLKKKYYIDAFFLLNNLYEKNDFGQKFFEDSFSLHNEAKVNGILDFTIGKIPSVRTGISRIKVSTVADMFPKFEGSISQRSHRNHTRDCKVIIVTSDLSTFSFMTSYKCSKLGSLTGEFYVPHFVLSPRLLAQTSAKCDYIVFKYFLRALRILAKIDENSKMITEIDRLFRSLMVSKIAVVKCQYSNDCSSYSSNISEPRKEGYLLAGDKHVNLSYRHRAFKRNKNHSPKDKKNKFDEAKDFLEAFYVQNKSSSLFTIFDFMYVCDNNIPNHVSVCGNKTGTGYIERDFDFLVDILINLRKNILDVKACRWFLRRFYTYINDLAQHTKKSPAINFTSSMTIQQMFDKDPVGLINGLMQDSDYRKYFGRFLRDLSSAIKKTHKPKQCKPKEKSSKKQKCECEKILKNSNNNQELYYNVIKSMIEVFENKIESCIKKEKSDLAKMKFTYVLYIPGGRENDGKITPDRYIKVFPVKKKDMWDPEEDKPEDKPEPAPAPAPAPAP
ncbi:hypothetical protein CWI36_0241p0010, partial [Hamiltosporidium magnivora]